MNDHDARGELAAASELIARRLGLHLPEERFHDLRRGLTSAACELGRAGPEHLLHSLAEGRLTARELETIACHLTVGETYFLREPESFARLEREILPAFVALRAETTRSLRIWCAGCCTGEEAYTLAISCLRVIPDVANWNVRILATDLNPRFLAKAEAGVYTEWSFRGVPASFKERWFTPAPSRSFRIRPEVRRLVRFAYLNLAEDIYPTIANETNAIDILFCRNVIMYFTPDHQRRVAAAFQRCLAAGGVLAVGPAESSHALFPDLDMEHRDGGIFFRSRSGKGSENPRSEFVPAVREPVAPAPAILIRGTSRPVPPPRAKGKPLPCPVAQVPLTPLEEARLRADEGRLADALVLCDRAVSADRTDRAAWFLRAMICDEQGRTDEAIDALKKVLYLEPDFVLAHHALGGLHRRAGRRRESGRHFAIALSLLARRGRDEPVPEGDGMTCGRLTEAIRAVTDGGETHVCA